MATDRRGTGRWALGAAALLVAMFATIVPAATAGASTGVSNLTVAIASPSSAAGALTTYKVGFKTSASGALSGSAGDTIKIVLPAGTGVTNLTGSVSVGATQIGFCFTASGTTATCSFYSSSSAAANTTVAVALNDVINPGVGTYTLKVSTSADATVVTSPTYSVVAGHSLSNLTVAMSSPSAAAGALTTYKVGFKASSTGGLSGEAGSTIKVVFPAGTVLTNLTGSVSVGATQIGFCDSATGTTATCQFYSSSSSAGSATVALAVNVVNPTTVGSYSVKVSTSSDLPVVTSPNYSVTAAQSLTSLTVANAAPSSAARALTTYAIGFKASSTGGLSGEAGSTIKVVFPAGTVLTNLTGSVSVGATQIGFCDSATGTTATCQLYSASNAAASANLKLAMNLVNPSTVGSTYTVKVSTSSDLTVVTSPRYSVTAAKSVSSASVVPNSTLPGATGVSYALSVKTSATGALSGETGSKITLVFPAGTGFTGFANNGTVKVGATQVGFCDSVTGTTMTCGLYSADAVGAGATMAINVPGLKNPTTAGTYTMKVSTTSDATVKPSAYCIVAAGVPCIASVTPGTGAIGAAVTITGLNLGGATALAFHGHAASILTKSATKITTTVPTGATTGTITVTTSGGTATSPASFKVIQPPGISGFSPPSGPVGTLVTINGTNLAKAKTVKFHTTTATVVTDTASQITVDVPTGATTGFITVTTAGGTATSATKFTVT